VIEIWGYRRTEGGHFTPWASDAQGRLWSGLLPLGLQAEGRRVRVLTAQGEAVPFTDELEAARREAEAERDAAREERQHEAAARRLAEDEVARLRAELARRREPGPQ
jgi:hypothetical protein